MPLEGRLLSAFVKRAEQLKKWQDSETNRTPADVPRHRPSRIKFPDGCVFLSACAAGDKEEVKHLLDGGADVDTVNVDGLTALHQACIDNNLDMVEFLVEEGANVDKQDNEGWTPLHAAVSCGSVAITEYLLQKGANPVAMNNDGELPIDLAENETVEELLQKEMDKLEIDCDSVRTLEEKTMLRDARNWFRNKKIEDNIHSRTGATALHVAAAKGYGEVLTLLIHSGADLNAQDYDGWTPLHAAAHWGQRIACRMLAENLANMNIQNNVGQTCFDVADADMVKLLEELRKMQESMQKERPEIKEILERTARTPPMRKTSVNRSVSAEKITAGSRPPPPIKEVVKVKFAPLVDSQPPKVDRNRPEVAEIRRPGDQWPAAKEESPEKDVPWRRPRRYAVSPPRNEEAEEEEEEEEEEVERTRSPEEEDMEFGEEVVYRYLLQKGANPVAMNNDGELPIDLAENETVEELLQKEMDKLEIDCDSVRTLEEKTMLRDARNWFRNKKIEDNIHSRTGATALHVAAAKGYGEVLTLLIHSGADLNAQDYDGWTPLHAAAHWGQRIACRMLAENLANMNIQNNVGQTCFDVADADMVKLLEELRKMQESMQKERPEIKEILERTARTPPMRKTSVNRSVSAEKITAGSRPPPPIKEVVKVKFAPLVDSQPPKVDRNRPEVAEIRRPGDQWPAAKEESPEKDVPWRRPRRYAVSPPRNEEAEEEEEEEEEEVERTRSPEEEDMEFGEEVVYRSTVPPVAGERPEMQRKAHAKRTRETRRPTQGVTSDELKLAQKLLLEKMARKELELGSEAPGSEDEDEEEEEEEKEETTKKENKFASRYTSAGSLPETGIGGASSLAGSSEDLKHVDYKKLYLELKEENEELREKLRKSEENLEKTKEQLQKAIQTNSRNEVERKERRSLERKISEMEEELKTLAKVKNENEKLKAENRALTRTVSKLTKKS
ncbi:protein phosphatase 1 regulatory subunit 12A-like [Centruroides sculpturatus]|uniref:protein phosphatase 1 regulatory subunit 12A-like n=1 Tax=Centruroides sculpturatus TaxID=218467 RepID=UPI000C6CB468|nr:protein phosphatase 1 regulatory subunit 12A-like [Centruroides sculpturatus]